MPSTLEFAVIDMYHQSGHYASNRLERSTYNSMAIFMEIPSINEFHEVPVLVFNQFPNRPLIRSNIPYVIRLQAKGSVPPFKTLNRNMVDILRHNPEFSGGLVTIDVPGNDSSSNIYYVANGIILSQQFKPLMLASWGLGSSETPILRIDPEVFIHQEDAMQRFIVKKILPCFLSSDFSEGSPKAIIEECPFNIRRVQFPDGSTSEEELRQIVADHVDDIVIV
jgi:hypothetical protein